MTVGQPVLICRNGRVRFTARVERVASPTRDVIMCDVRRAEDGRPARTTSFRHSLPLVLRAKGRTGTIIGAGGYGGEMVVEADEWDH